MQKFPVVKRLVLASAIAVAMVACGDSGSERELSKEEVQFLSHLDQARFYQKQGQLRASIEEAQNALKLDPASRDPFLIVADNLLIAGDARSAEKQYRELLQPEKDQAKVQTGNLHNRAVIGLATSLAMQKRIEESRETLTKLKEPSKEDEAESLMLEGDMLFSEDKIEEAKAAYNKAREATPSAVKPLIALSRLSATQNKPEDADALIAEADKLNPNDSELWLWKAQLAESRQNYAKAEDAYIKALDDIGRYDLMTYKKYQTMSRLIAVLRAQGKSAEAFVYEEILAKSAPGTIKSGYDAALKLYQEGKYNEAAKELEKILQQAPGHTDSGILLGMIRYAQGDLKEAEKYLSQYSEEGTPPAVRKMLAATKIKLQQPEEAAQILRKLEDTDKDPEILSLLGIASLASGETEEGLTNFNKALELNPDNLELRIRLARYYLSINQPEIAQEQVDKVLAKEKSNDEARTLMTSILVRSGKLDQAAAYAKDWLKASPNNTAALNALGSISIQQGDEAAARKYFKQAIDAVPHNALPLLNLANLDARKQDWSGAQDTYIRALKVDPENLAAISGVVQTSKQLGGSGSAIKALEQIANSNPKAVNVRLALAELYANDLNIDKAQQLVDETAKIAPEERRIERFQTSIYRIAVERQLADKQFDPARNLTKQALAIHPDDLELGMLSAKVEFLAEKPDEALNIIQQLKKTHKTSSVPLEVEGDYYASTKDYTKALEAYRSAWNLQNSQSLAIKMHQTLRAANQNQEALQPLKDWLNIQPNSPQAMTLLAMGYQADGQFDKAIEEYEKLRKIRPNDAVALNNLAWLYHEKGNSQAESTAATAYEISPQSAAIADTYGWILVQNKKLKEGLDVLKKAYELDPNTQEIALHLADAYEQLGQNDEAKTIRDKFKQ